MRLKKQKTNPTPVLVMNGIFFSLICLVLLSGISEMLCKKKTGLVLKDVFGLEALVLVLLMLQKNEGQPGD